MNKYTVVLMLCVSHFTWISALAQEKPAGEALRLKESLSETKHRIVIGGEEIRYTARAGNLLLKDETGDTTASIFFISYSKDHSKNMGQRPIAFVFNGGPGSSSVWLHMGMLGPKRVLMSDNGKMLHQPFQYVENAYSLLDETDLVFIDPVSTGYSRAASEEALDDFHGVQEDIESMGDFIHLYVSRYERWLSPKFLIGESYGTFRSAGLSEYLQDRHGIYPIGLILISTVLNFQTIIFDEGNDLPYITFLPGYAATAWYHKKIGLDLQDEDLQTVLERAEAFALGEYASSLLKGNLLTDTEYESVAEKLSGFTGLGLDFVKQENLRINGMDFFRELLREDHLIVGRNDSRFTRTNHVEFTGALDEIFYYDPSHAAVQGPFTATFNAYLRRELQFKNDEVYEIFFEHITSWNPGEFESRYLNTATSLHRAMVKNPDLRVFVACGYYDLASPYFVTKYTFNHLFVDETLRENISFGFYDGGHMMYIEKESLKQLKYDLSGFIGTLTP